MVPRLPMIVAKMRIPVTRKILITSDVSVKEMTVPWRNPVDGHLFPSPILPIM